MAVITPDTFDPLRSYIGVRLQQGVPLVDADWNEAHDVRKFEVQAFLKWFVGNGVPEGNDGFRIAGLDPAVVRDFVIRRGVSAAPTGTSGVERGLRHVGRCLVDGMDVLIAEDLNFRAQPLHVSRGTGATARATALGVPTIAEVPNVTGTVVVYLDVWERLVTPTEDPHLVHSGLGVESCARLKREWVVRTRAGSSVPAPGDADSIAGHSYYTLATIAHQAGVPITSEAIADQRERRLLVPPATLIEDLFGPVDYRRGQGRPLVNLREAINTLLRGELPGSLEAPIRPEASGFGVSLGHGMFFDAANGLITTWGRSGQFGPMQIFAARLSLTMPEAGFSTVQQITGPSGGFHHATPLDTGEALVVYETVDTAPNIVMKRGMLATLNPNSPAITVTDTAASERFPFAVAVGGEVLIFWHEDAGNTWQFKRYNVANGSFSTALPLAGIATTAAGERHAAVDSTNTVWVAFTTHSANQHGSQIQVIAVPPGGLPGQPQPLIVPNDHNRNPFVMVDNRDNVWVFWYVKTSDETSVADGIWYRRFLRATMAWETAAGTEVPGTTAAVMHGSLAAVSDAEGGIWLFWARSTPGAANMPSAANIWYARRNPVTQIWGEPRQITRHPGAEDTPVVLRGPDGSFWLFWIRNFGDIDLTFSQPFYRRLFLSI
jgi:Family of unknown function (DUF6519)